MFGTIFWGIQFHGEYITPVADKALKKTPTKADVSLPLKGDGTGLVSLEPIWHRSLFAAYRGETETAKVAEPSAADARKRAVMELIGVCKFGSFSGATILDKTPVRRTPGQTPKKAGAVFYRLGETLGSGYVLKKVMRNSVILVRGSSELVLEMDFGSDTSKKRNDAEVKNQSEMIENEVKRLAGEPEKQSKENVTAVKKAVLPAVPAAPIMGTKKLDAKAQKSKRVRMLKSLRSRTSKLVKDMSKLNKNK